MITPFVDSTPPSPSKSSESLRAAPSTLGQRLVDSGLNSVTSRLPTRGDSRIQDNDCPSPNLQAYLEGRGNLRLHTQFLQWPVVACKYFLFLVLVLTMCKVELAATARIRPARSDT